MRERCGIGRSRANEYVSIAEGKKTAEEINERARNTMRRTREVRNVTDFDALRKSHYECEARMMQT